MITSVISTVKYIEAKKTPIRDGIFYVMQNPENNLYFSSKFGAVEDINRASHYKSVGLLKSVINKIYYPQHSIMLRMLEEAGVWEKHEFPKDAFDECLIHEIVVTE